MSYFDDHEDDIIYSRPLRKKKKHSGKPAAKGSALAQARILAHSAFDTLWQSGQMTRSVAYRVLARQLDIAKHECHIGNFDQATCEKVIALYVPNEFEVLE